MREHQVACDGETFLNSNLDATITSIAQKPANGQDMMSLRPTTYFLGLLPPHPFLLQKYTTKHNALLPNMIYLEFVFLCGETQVILLRNVVIPGPLLAVSSGLTACDALNSLYGQHSSHIKLNNQLIIECYL